MLKAAQRLRTSSGFRHIISGGVRAGRATLVVHGRECDGVQQVGIVVSKAVGNAVVRNRVKRRLRALAAQCDLPSSVVIRALPGAHKASFATLRADFSGALAAVATKVGQRK